MKNLSVSGKLILGFGCVLVLMIITAVISVNVRQDRQDHQDR
jgi:CHASE3 domain sensor protein